MYCLGFWGRMVCLTSVLYETLQVVEQVHWEWRVSDAPRPHHTSSDQLSGSRCCLSQEASPTASPEACVWVFSLRHVGALCVYDFFLKAKPDKSDSTLKEDLVTSARAGGRTCQTIRLPRTTGKMLVRWYVKRQRALIDGLFAVYVKLASPQKFTTCSVLLMHA